MKSTNFISRSLHLAPCTLHLAPCTLHLAPCTLHLAPCTLHLARPSFRKDFPLKWIRYLAVSWMLLTFTLLSAQSISLPNCLFGETVPPISSCNIPALNGVVLKMGQPTASSACSNGTRFPVFFEKAGGTGTSTSIRFKSIRVRFRITGDAQFDPVFFQQSNNSIYNMANIGSPYTPNATKFIVDGKTLDWLVYCTTDGQHRMAIGTPSIPKPVFSVGLITDAGNANDPNDNISVSIEISDVSGLSGDGVTVSQCKEDCCIFPAVSPMSFMLPSSTPLCSPSNIVGSFGLISPPSEQEAKLYSVTLNNSGQAVPYEELDFRIRFTDYTENLPPVFVSTIPFTTSQPLMKEEIFDENGANPGETSTFYYKFGPGTLLSGTTTLADITVLDPIGFENLLGQGKFFLEYVRIKPQGSPTCCKLMEENGVSVEFDGVSFCGGNSPTIKLLPLTSTGTCTSLLFEFSNIGQAPLLLDELLLDLNVSTTGQMGFYSMHSANFTAGLSCVNANNGSCPTGCVEVCGNHIRVNFVNSGQGPLTIYNGDGIAINFAGPYGGISNIEVLELKIKQPGQGACIPNFTEDPTLQFPMNKCNFCSDATALITPYQGAVPLNSGCENGFSMFMDFGTEPVDEIYAVFELEKFANNTPVNINLAKSASFCDVVPNSGCFPGTPCLQFNQFNPDQIILHYCGPPISGNIRVLDIAVQGIDVVSGINIVNGFFYVRRGQTTCDLHYLGSGAVFPMVPTGPSCLDWNILGKITYSTPNGSTKGVTYANINISTALNPNLATAVTSPNCSGEYQTAFNSSSSNILITPQKNCNSLNGITTFDLWRMSQYVLYGTPFSTNPNLAAYWIIAADANKSGSVSTLDIIEVRKLILFINQSFSQNTSWRFVPKSHVFPNPFNPFNPVFPESELVNYPPPTNGIDFVGIKVGDTNGSAQCETSCNSPFSPNDLPSERAMPVLLKTNELQLEPGETGWIDFILHAKRFCANV